jgi:hypothetical protein
MDADDSKYWGLFENRPAKERTSPPPCEASQEFPRAAGSWDRWAGLHRAPGTVAERERAKC